MFYEVEQHIALLQNYIDSESKENFIEQLNNPTEKIFLKLLTASVTDIQQYKKDLQKLQVGFQFRQAILKYKLKHFVEGCTQPPNKKLLAQLKNQFGSGVSFNYEKPANIRREEMVQEDDTSARIQILSKETSVYLNQKVMENNNFLFTMEHMGITLLTEKTLMKLEFWVKERLFRQNSFLIGINPTILQKLFSSYYVEYKKQHKSKQNLDTFSFQYDKLTKQQLNFLGKKHADLFHNISFCKEWLSQHYRHILEDYSQVSSENLQRQKELLQHLSKIQEQLGKYNKSFPIKIFEYTMLTQILATETELGEAKEMRLGQYLNNEFSHFTAFPFFTEKFRSKLKNKCTINYAKMQQLSQIFKTQNLKLRGSQKPANMLIEDYIIELFKNYDPNKKKGLLERMGQMIENNYLMKILTKVKLMNGQKCQDATDHLAHSQLVQFKEKKEIKLSERNKKIYKAEDQVNIHVVLKNVKELDIKIYELNLLKEYLTNNSDAARNYDDINLSYFSPSYTEKYVNSSENPFEFKQVNLLVKSIPNKIGIFVVDIQGEGITSRAVIRKGSIICLDSYSMQGQHFSFYNEEGKELSQKDGLSIWLEKRQVSLQNGSVFNSSTIAADKRDSNTQIIASLGCFAQKFIRDTQHNYFVNLNAIYNSQSFINENKAKIILKGILLLNGNELPLHKLKNIRVIVNQLTGQVITSSNTYEFVEWKQNREQMVEFFPQADINTINVLLKGCIEDGKQITVESNKIQINLTSNTQIEQMAIVQPYLKQLRNQNYQLSLKGKNGEGIQHKEVSLEFQMKGSKQREKFKFITDKDGVISLGNLHAVRGVHYSTDNINRVWNVDRVLENHSYNLIRYVFPGQEITIPVQKAWTVKDVLLMHYLSQKCQKNDETEKVTVKDGILTFKIAERKSSSYKLTLFPIGIEINFEVITEGIRWKNKFAGKQILVDANEGKIIKLSRGSAMKNVCIGDVELRKSDQTKAVCEIDLKNYQKLSHEELNKVRVHVLASNYLSPNIEGKFSACGFSLAFPLAEQCRKLNKSSYLSNKTLSEEAAYIFNRQKEKGRIGSNLEKPGLFLKRLSVRQTQNVIGQLQKEGQFEAQANNANKRANINTTFRTFQRGQRNITRHNNFLSQSGFVTTNLGPKAIIQIPKGYSHIEVYLLSPEHTTKATFSLEDDLSNSKDIRYKGLDKCTEGKSWNISRQVYNIKQGQNISFNKKCEYKVVTLKQVFEYAEKIIFAGGSQKLHSWKDNYILWHGFSHKEKVNIYNKFFCHELNTFIKFKDEAFFKTIVAPYIKNKYKKSFIDLCLLQDSKICEYLNINKLLLLNNFECVLFVFALMKLNKKDEAKRIAQRMQLSFAKNLPFKVKSQKFDFVINSFVGKQQIKPIVETFPIQVAMQAIFQKKGKKRGRRASSECSFDSAMASVCQNVGNRRRMRSESECMMSEDDFDLRKSQMMYIPPAKLQKKNDVESTKECTEQTYFYEQGQNYPQHQHKQFISSFWPELAKHFLEGGDGNFTSSSFTQFRNGLEVMLAAAFIPGRQANTSTLEDSGEKYSLKANIGVSLFVKEQKEYEFSQKDGVYIYQTISTMSTLEPGKEVISTENRAGQQYFLSTIFSNSTSDFLDLQILCPIPEGSIPLKSKQVTIIQNNLGPFKTDIFKQSIYFPASGLYKLPPANILDMSSDKVIAHSPVNLPIAVIKPNEGKKLESFEDIIQYGSKGEILDFLKNKNIFSNQLFKPSLILWMLTDEDFFEKVVKVLRNRFYFDAQIWKFSLLHGNCQALKQYLNLQRAYASIPKTNILVPTSQYERLHSIGDEAYEYYPYFQKRTHRYANQNRSAIKNVQLKQTYINFLVAMTISSHYKQPQHKLAHAYYLILQDRLAQAHKIVEELTQKDKEMCELQLDYIRCFLDMGLNGQNCELARKIAPKYAEYPIVPWRKLFAQIMDTLKEPPQNEFQSKENLETKVILLENGDISIKRSLKKQIKVEIFPTNMELFFTEHSFEIKKSISNFSISKPIKQILIDTNNANSEVIISREEFKEIKNPYIEISEHGNHSHKKIKSLIWTDPRIIAKLYEQQGVVQVFVDGKRAPGSYVKVFTIRKGLKRPTSDAKYYVDGYTDIAGKFKYGLTDLNQIEQFALLMMTDAGAIIKYVQPPKVKGAEGKKGRKADSSDSQRSDSESS